MQFLAKAFGTGVGKRLAAQIPDDGVGNAIARNIVVNLLFRLT